MPKIHHVILIHPDAPIKPVPGAPCNGCGVCCLLEPCPIGVILSRRRQGACVAVRWLEDEQQYRCGVLSQPLGRLAPWLSPLRSFLTKRWIAVDRGCDSTVEPERPVSAQTRPTQL